MPKTFKTKSGFTIIEVVLVLAIAGLIFMAVFIALPALQKSQRDTQRKADVERVVAKINDYQAANRNELPDGTASDISSEKYESGKAIRTWEYFYHNYLLTESSDKFSDPQSNNPYKLTVLTDKPSDYQKDTIYVSRSGSTNGFDCNGEEVVTSTGNKRKVAVSMKSEAAGIICVSN